MDAGLVALAADPAVASGLDSGAAVPVAVWLAGGPEPDSEDGAPVAVPFPHAAMAMDNPATKASQRSRWLQGRIDDRPDPPVRSGARDEWRITAES